MKKFLVWYAAICAAVLLVPSFIGSVAAFAAFSDPMAPAGFGMLAALTAFGGTMLIVGMMAFYPALIVLAIGVIVCLCNKR